MARKVLIVEDDGALQLLLKDNLELEGLQVVVAGTGKEALETAWKSLPDLAMVDLGLPDMTGWELCRLLRADFRTKTLPICIVTAGSAKESTPAEMKSLDIRHFIRKPYDPIAIATLVKGL